MPFVKRVERYFEFAALGTNWKTEFLAGVTTFMTMAYIVFVNPSILRDAGMPAAGVTAATCLAAAVGSLLMGAFARYPIALAPGMGLNAYFAYSVVKGMGVDWHVALGAVFLSGVAFLLLTAIGIRQMIVNAIPQELYSAVAAGVGLFIALIGFRNAGIVVPSQSTIVALGDLHAPATLLALFGLLLMAVLLCARWKAAILIGVVATWVLAVITGNAHWQPQPYSIRDITSTAMQLDIRGALRLGLVEIVFVFLFVDLFDNVGTLLAVGKKAGLFGHAGGVPRLNRILTSDAIATVAGSLAGTSTVVSYIESSAGVAAGGRSGVTAIVTGLLFAVALFTAPLAGAIPGAATAPALIVVGSMMMTAVAEIAWTDPEIAIPAFLTMLAIPLTYSIANGLAFGFCAYTLIKVLRGRFRQVNWMVYGLTLLFLVRFYYLGKNT
ncbi:MAG TPA: NCS2 family permease [Bryobacteraceae bacterium]|jgi:AGZA family xanthine/uracil permease-like MFS transporter|nr:NCS2 family permease [Bryobacteraceae bacterium]